MITLNPADQILEQNMLMICWEFLGTSVPECIPFNFQERLFVAIYRLTYIIQKFLPLAKFFLILLRIFFFFSHGLSFYLPPLLELLCPIQ